MNDVPLSPVALPLPPWYRRREFWFYFLIVAGLLLRLEYFREYARQDYFSFALGPDVSDYHIRAQRILQGAWWPDAPDIHAPLYSLFLALLYGLTGFSIPFVRLFQLLLSWGAWIPFYFLIAGKKGNGKVALCFLAFAMATPSVIYHQGELVSESLLIPLTALFFLLDDSAQKDPECRRKRFLSGMAAALLVLTHGLMLCFLTARGAWMLCRKQWRAFGLFSAGAALVLGSVILSKSIVYGELTGVQANSMFNVYLGNNPAATGGCYMRPGLLWRRFHAQIESEALQRHSSPARIYAGRIASFFREEPLQALLILPLRKMGMLLMPVELISGADPGFLVYRTPLQYAARGLAGVVLFFFLAGLFRVFRERDGRWTLWLLLVFSLGAGEILTVTAGRYRMGMMPGVLLLAALGAEKFRWKHFLWLPLLFCLLTMAVNRGTGNSEEAASIIGEARMKQRQWESARNLLIYAGRKLNDPSRFENMLALIDWEEGNLQGAEEHYRNVLSLEPEAPDAWLGLGQLLLLNRPEKQEEAGALLEHYTRLVPNRPEGWNYLGAAHLYAKRAAEAEACFARAVALAPGDPGYRKNREIARTMLQLEQEKNKPSPRKEPK